MKAFLFAGCGTVAFAAFAPMACATAADGDEVTLPDAADANVTVIPDGGALELDASGEASPGETLCSAAGWCPTALPDTELLMKDIWPLPGRAFAVAESATLGVKVLEWTDAEAKWTYIDDGAQNEPG